MAHDACSLATQQVVGFVESLFDVLSMTEHIGLLFQVFLLAALEGCRMQFVVLEPHEILVLAVVLDVGPHLLQLLERLPVFVVSLAVTV